MSKLITNAIKHTGASSDNIVLNSNGTTAITGHIIQTTYAQYKTQNSVAGDAYTDSGLTGNITTASASNKVLVRVCLNVAGDGADRYTVSGRLYRGGSHVTDASASDNGSRPGTWFTVGAHPWTNYVRYNVYAEYLDSPGSAATHQYKVYLRDHRNNDTVHINRAYYDADSASTPVGTSSITLQEIVA